MASPAQPTPASWEDIVTTIAKQHGVNPRLALAIAKRESSVDPSAVGDSGKAIGMFQLHEAAAADMGLSPEDRSDPIKNITAGIGYFKRQSDRFGGDVNKALMAYNGGAEHVEGGTMSPQAQAYASDVLADLSGSMRAMAMTPALATSMPAPVASHARPTPAPAFATLPMGTQSTPTGERFAPSQQFSGGEPATHSALLGDIRTGVVQQFDPTTPEGRVNLAATAAAGAASFVTGPETLGAQPVIAGWLTRVLGPPAAAAVAAGTERGLEQQVLGTTPAAAPGALHTAGTQALYEVGGQTLMWPIRRTFKAFVSGKIARAAETGLKEEAAATRAGLSAARDAAKLMTERAEDLGASATASARRAAVDKVVDIDLDNTAAINAIQSQYDNLLRAGAPDGSATVGQVRATLEGPSKKALDMAGQRVAAAAETGPAISMGPIKEELTRITRKAKPASLFPSQPVQAAGFVPSNRVSLPASAAAQMQGMTQADLRAFVHEQLTKPAAERLPLSGILDTLQKAPEQLDFVDAHALKRLLDETVNWNAAERQINKQLTKGIRTTLREALAVHEPYNEATGAYRALATLYREGTGAKLTRTLRNNPDAAARILDDRNPIAAQAVYDLLVTQSAAGGEPAMGQAAWDAVRSSYLYNNVLDGGIKGLSARVRALAGSVPAGHVPVTRVVRTGDPLMGSGIDAAITGGTKSTWFHEGHLRGDAADLVKDMYAGRTGGKVVHGYVPEGAFDRSLGRTDEFGNVIGTVKSSDLPHVFQPAGGPEFARIVFGDEAGQRVISNLDTLGRAYDVAKQTSEAFSSAAKLTGEELVDTTKLAAKQTIRSARQQGQRGIQAAKAGVTAAETAQRQFGESSLAPFASRTAAQAGAETARAGFLGIKTYWGARAIARMLESPSSADVLAYLAYSPRLTQMATQVMLGQAPDRVSGILLRDIGAALTPPMPSHTREQMRATVVPPAQPVR
jgi:hypothetical protein